MRGKLALAAGLAVGFVIGSRAGRPAYESLAARVRDIADSGTTHDVVDKAKEVLEDRAPRVAAAAETVAGAASTVRRVTGSRRGGSSPGTAAPAA